MPSCDYTQFEASRRGDIMLSYSRDKMKARTCCTVVGRGQKGRLCDPRCELLLLRKSARVNPLGNEWDEENNMYVRTYLINEKIHARCEIDSRDKNYGTRCTELGRREKGRPCDPGSELLLLGRSARVKPRGNEWGEEKINIESMRTSLRNEKSTLWV